MLFCKFSCVNILCLCFSFLFWVHSTIFPVLLFIVLQLFFLFFICSIFFKVSYSRLFFSSLCCFIVFFYYFVFFVFFCLCFLVYWFSLYRISSFYMFSFLFICLCSSLSFFTHSPVFATFFVLLYDVNVSYVHSILGFFIFMIFSFLFFLVFILFSYVSCFSFCGSFLSTRAVSQNCYKNALKPNLVQKAHGTMNKYILYKKLMISWEWKIFTNTFQRFLALYRRLRIFSNLCKTCFTYKNIQVLYKNLFAPPKCSKIKGLFGRL